MQYFPSKSIDCGLKHKHIVNKLHRRAKSFITFSSKHSISTTELFLDSLGQRGNWSTETMVLCKTTTDFEPHSQLVTLCCCC